MFFFFKGLYNREKIVCPWPIGFFPSFFSRFFISAIHNISNKKGIVLCTLQEE